MSTRSNMNNRSRTNDYFRMNNHSKAPPHNILLSDHGIGYARG